MKLFKIKRLKKYLLRERKKKRRRESQRSGLCVFCSIVGRLRFDEDFRIIILHILVP